MKACSPLTAGRSTSDGRMAPAAAESAGGCQGKGHAMDARGLIAWIVIGLVAGLLANFVMELYLKAKLFLNFPHGALLYRLAGNSGVVANLTLA